MCAQNMYILLVFALCLYVIVFARASPGGGQEGPRDAPAGSRGGPGGSGGVAGGLPGAPEGSCGSPEEAGDPSKLRKGSPGVLPGCSASLVP